jgi:hypothetical protein
MMNLREKLTKWARNESWDSDATYDEMIHLADLPQGIDFDFENCYFEGFQQTPSGIEYLCGCAGGDWEHPVVFIVYWNDDDDSPIMYIPKGGNVVDWENKRAYYSPDFEDDEDGRRPPEGADFNVDKLRQDIIEFLGGPPPTSAAPPRPIPHPLP